MNQSPSPSKEKFLNFLLAQFSFTFDHHYIIIKILYLEIITTTGPTGQVSVSVMLYSPTCIRMVLGSNVGELMSCFHGCLHILPLTE